MKERKLIFMWQQSGGPGKRSPFFINLRENFTDVLEENFLELIGIEQLDKITQGADSEVGRAKNKAEVGNLN